MESGGTRRNIENCMHADEGVIIIRLYYNNNITI